jgi:hypothetical protein
MKRILSPHTECAGILRKAERRGKEFGQLYFLSAGMTPLWISFCNFGRMTNWQ